MIIVEEICTNVHKCSQKFTKVHKLSLSLKLCGFSVGSVTMMQILATDLARPNHALSNQ
jgi:hypothetical protein